MSFDDPPYRPLVGVSACRKQIAPHPFHGVGEKYLTAVSTAGGAPWIIPALGGQIDIKRILAVCDGLLFTGSASNVEPWRYGERLDDAAMQRDPHRDATTLPLLRAAIENGVPVLCVCRGFQELNVVFGGTLHRRLQDVDPYADHREDDSASLDEKYAASHTVQPEPGGLLAGLVGEEPFEVNSLHSQGIKSLGKGLRIEARAADGLVEAVSFPGAATFVLGVQWHPEWHARVNTISTRIFEAFGVACRQYQHQRNGDDAIHSAVV